MTIAAAFAVGVVIGWFAAGVYTLAVIAWTTRTARHVTQVDVWAGDTTQRLNQLHRAVYGRPRPNGRAN